MPIRHFLNIPSPYIYIYSFIIKINYVFNCITRENKTSAQDSHVITVLSPCWDSLSLVIAATLAKLMSSIHYMTDKNIWKMIGLWTLFKMAFACKSNCAHNPILPLSYPQTHGEVSQKCVSVCPRGCFE